MKSSVRMYLLATDMKSAPRKTPFTPAMPKSRAASGDTAAASADGKFAVPSAITGHPGTNFMVAGLGVGSVTTLIMLRPSPQAELTVFQQTNAT